MPFTITILRCNIFAFSAPGAFYHAMCLYGVSFKITFQRCRLIIWRVMEEFYHAMLLYDMHCEMTIWRSDINTLFTFETFSDLCYEAMSLSCVSCCCVGWTSDLEALTRWSFVTFVVSSLLFKISLDIFRLKRFLFLCIVATCLIDNTLLNAPHHYASDSHGMVVTWSQLA